MSFIPKVGETIWVWHFDSLTEKVVEEVTEISGLPAVLYKGFATIHFFKTRIEALEFRVKVFCNELNRLPSKGAIPAYQVKDLKELARSTYEAFKNEETDECSKDPSLE